MIVCQCRVVSDRDITEALEAGATTLGRVCRATGAGSDCGGCVLGVRSALAAYARTRPCPLHAVPGMISGPTDTSPEETDAAPQPARRRVA